MTFENNGVTERCTWLGGLTWVLVSELSREEEIFVYILENGTKLNFESHAFKWIFKVTDNRTLAMEKIVVNQAF